MSRTENLGTILGLNNRLPETRLDVALPNNGKANWLRVASNIDLTATGFIRRRQGCTLSAASEYHSLWADDRDAYVARGGDLVHINVRSLAQTVVVAGIGQHPVCFERLPDGMVYWSNYNRIGRLQGAVSREVVTPTPNPVPTAYATGGSLPAGRYQICFTAVGPDGESPSTEPQAFSLPDGGGIAVSGLQSNTRVYVTGPNGDIFNEIAPGNFVSLGNTGASCSTFMLRAMPGGNCIAHYCGSLLVARASLLYVSQPYEYGLFNIGRAFIPFPADISVIAPCEDGIYLCADKTYWIPGDPLNTQPTVVLPFGALPGSMTRDPKSQTVYWQSPLGLVIGKPGGQVSLPQDAALLFGTAHSGATLVREQGGETHIVTARFDAEAI